MRKFVVEVSHLAGDEKTVFFIELADECDFTNTLTFKIPHFKCMAGVTYILGSYTTITLREVDYTRAEISSKIEGFQGTIKTIERLKSPLSEIDLAIKNRCEKELERLNELLPKLS